MSANQKRNLYSVWKNDEHDTLLIVDGTADQCAALMDIQRSRFYELLSRPTGKYTIIRTKERDLIT